jgi:hypothetical protein
VGTLPAGGVSRVTITCPQGRFSTGGTFFGSGPGDTGETTLAASEFDGMRKYTVRVRSLATTSQHYVAGAVCAANYLPG